MIRRLIKMVLKYPIIFINRIYLWFYFKTRKINEKYEEIVPKGNEKILVLSPHVDDETIGLGGTIIKYHNSESKMSLVYLTDGSGSISHKSKEETAKERMEEGYKIKESYGFHSVYFVEKVDGTLDSKDKKLIGEIIEILDKEKPDIIFSPFLIDGNIDHVETTKSLEKALAIWNKEFENIYLYVVNSLIHPKIINKVSFLDKNTYMEKLDRFNIFQSQWAMGFSVFNLLDRRKALMYGKGYAVENFVGIDYGILNEIIDKLEKEKFNPQIFKQISSEFTLIYAFMKSRKEKKLYSNSVKKIIENKELGGSSHGAY
jgi:LmbE family N-acetylglucosaminyl deacetylase